MIQQLNLIKWSFRKIVVPIYNNGLNLEVGSGGNPHPMADVLLDKYIDDRHRLRAIKIDRPMILADASKMPFRDKSFDFIFAYHILEHVDEPSMFLLELQRVGKGGYIETPNALYERICPLTVHRSEIFLINNKLYIFKKKLPKSDDFISNLKILERDKYWSKLFYNNPQLFHCCYLWKGKIDYEVVNIDVRADWVIDLNSTDVINNNVGSVKRSWRSSLINVIRNFRSKTIDIDKILVCPECKSDLFKTNDYYQCTSHSCSLKFKRKPLPDFTNPI